jgi:WD40 repeat protein
MKKINGIIPKNKTGPFFILLMCVLTVSVVIGGILCFKTFPETKDSVFNRDGGNHKMQEIKRLHVKGAINAIAWNKDGSRLAALSLYGSTITVWETKNWGIINEFHRSGGSYSNNSFAFLPDGSLITAAPLGDYKKDPFHPDSANIPAPFNRYETLEIFSLIQWNPETGVPVRYIPDLGFPPKDVSLKITDTFALSRDGSMIAAIHADDVLLYETSRGSLVRKLLIPRIPTAKFIWNYRKPPDLPSFFADSPYSLAFSPDGKELAVGTMFGMVHFFSVKDGTLRGSLEAYPGGLIMCKEIAYSPDGRFIATGKYYNSTSKESDKITTDVWRVSDHKKIASLEGEVETFADVEMPSHVSSLSWSPQDDTLVVADGGSLRVWQISESNSKLLFVQKLGGINSTGYSPQGILATTSHNEIIILH